MSLPVTSAGTPCALPSTTAAKAPEQDERIIHLFGNSATSTLCRTLLHALGFPQSISSSPPTTLSQQVVNVADAHLTCVNYTLQEDATPSQSSEKVIQSMKNAGAR